MNIKTMKDLLTIFIVIILGWMLLEREESYREEVRDNRLRELTLELTRDSLRIYQDHYENEVMPIIEFQKEWDDRLADHYNKIKQ